MSRKTKPHLRETFRFDCWNGTNPEEHFGEKYFFGKAKIFFRLPLFEQNFCGLQAERFKQGRKSRSLGLQRNILTKLFEEKHSFHHFCTSSADFYPDLSKNVWQARQKYNPGVQRNSLRKSNNWRSKKNFVIFVLWAKTFRTFGEKQKLQVCHNWILRVHRNIYGKFLWKVPLIFITFGIWVKNCQLIGRRISARLSKMQSECPGEPSEKKLIFLKGIYVLFDRCWTSSFCFRTLTRIVQYGYPNCISRVHWKGLSRNIFFGKVYSVSLS